MLNPLLENKELFESWDGQQGAAGLAALRWTLYSAIITDLHALLFDKYSNTASLKKVIEKLEKTELKDKLEEDYARCNDVNIVNCNEELESMIDMNSIKKSYVGSQNEELEKKFHKIHPQTIKGF